MKKIVIAILCTISLTNLTAQNRDARQEKREERREKISQLIKQEEEGALIFNKQSIFGIKLSTDGYGAFYEFGKLKTPTKTTLYSFELGERKHPKEEKVPQNFAIPIGNPYIYGKVNNFYFAKLGVGQQRLIGGKGNKNGVAISAIYGGGFSAGLLKPYYLEVDGAGGNRRDIKFDGGNDSVFLSAQNIYGASSFGKGWNEIKFVPGVYAKTALRFDYGRFNETVSAIEVGLNWDFYTQRMPILLWREGFPDVNKPRNFFFSAYASIVFGRRK
ncbi:hypothetical protein [Aridibaculum aurantiacum]|uniref:hypothetical protein n=1 Tax=Aridibaculum aurantiacum TaxID=2810307 RepID=UPI001A9706FF|nr:hypothetical protein [Aridibaculum aurantiacum]